MKRSGLAACLVALPFALSAQTQPIAFVGARILPIVGAPIEKGALVIANGRIVSVGSAEIVPPDATRIDATGRTIMPGLVDTHSHIGGGSGADSSGPIQPDVRILDSINVRDAGIQKAQAGGVTTVNIMPGSGYLNSGQTIYLKLRDGRTIDDMTIRSKDGGIAGGMKFANGTNPMRSAPFPGTRAKSAALIRAQLMKARDYQEKRKRAGSDASKLPDRDLAMEALGEVLDRKRVVHFHTHRHDDILTALRIAKEFNLKIVLQHVSEAHKVAEEIAAAKAAASIIIIDSPGGKLETMDYSSRNGAALERAGVLTAYHTDDGITDSRHFLRSAGIGVRYGMSREKALEAMTIAGARMLELDDRIGSLEPGKDADFIILSGDPLSVYTHVLETWVDGRKVFDRSEPKDRLYAVGGYGASDDQVMHLHEGDLD